MVAFNSSRYHGAIFLAMILAVIGSWGEVADAQSQHLYIPYNGGNPQKFGDNGPYTAKDPLRQHLHVYQMDSNFPTPVFFYAHQDGAKAEVPTSSLKIFASVGYSVVSWESATTISTDTTESCQDDFELVWSWFQDNAEKYHLDPNTVVIGGRSRGALCSWPLAFSEKPGIIGAYMLNALQDSVWVKQFYDGLSYLWERVITENAPPAHLVYGAECPKPITQECDKMPKFGQKIVDIYADLGIESRIQLTDGISNKKGGLMDPFPDFANSLDGFSHPSSGSSSAGTFTLCDYSSSSSGSESGSYSSSSGSESGSYSSSSGSESGSYSSSSGSESGSYSSSSGSESGSYSSSSSSTSGSTTYTATKTTKSGLASTSASSEKEHNSGIYYVFGVGTVCIAAFFAFEKYSEEQENREQENSKFIDDGHLSLTEMGQSSYKDNIDELPPDTYKDESTDEPKEKRRKKKRKKLRKKRDKSNADTESKGLLSSAVPI